MRYYEIVTRREGRPGVLKAVEPHVNFMVAAVCAANRKHYQEEIVSIAEVLAIKAGTIYEKNGKEYGQTADSGLVVELEGSEDYVLIPAP